MRHLEGLIPLSRRVLSSALALGRQLEEAVFAVDATAGNGQDTFFLASEAGKNGRVWAFDVREDAIARARERFKRERPGILGRVSFVLAGHETAKDVLPVETSGRLRAVTFNLGYLPSSDKRMATKASSTLQALDTISAMLAVGGVISVHSYQGHAGGDEEDQAVRRWFEACSWEEWRVAGYFFLNKNRNRETLYLAERLDPAGEQKFSL